MESLKRYNSYIKIRDIRVIAHIGVLEYEKIDPQELLVSCIIYQTEPPHGCISDDMSDIICYAKIVNEIKKFSLSRHFNLIENYGFSLIQLLEKKFHIKKVEVTIVKKPLIEMRHENIEFSIANFKM